MADNEATTTRTIRLIDGTEFHAERIEDDDGGLTAFGIYARPFEITVFIPRQAIVWIQVLRGRNQLMTTSPEEQAEKWDAETVEERFGGSIGRFDGAQSGWDELTESARERYRAMVRAAARYWRPPSTQPVSESPGDSGERLTLKVVVSGAPFEVNVHRDQPISTLITAGLLGAGIKVRDDLDTTWQVRTEQGVLLENLSAVQDGATLFLDPEEGGGASTQPVPRNSGGVEEGEAEKLSFEDLEALAKAAAQAAAPVFRAQGWTWRDTDDCEFVPGEDELQEKVHHLLHRAQQRAGVASIGSGRFHVDVEIEDGREVATVLLNLRDSLDDASTQPPSPQAEVQDCELAKEMDRAEAVERYLDEAREPSTPHFLEEQDTGKQPPAEPQGDAVEKLAEEIAAIPFYKLTEESKDHLRKRAREYLAAITPLLPGPSYALEVKERLGKLPVYMAPTGTDENPQVFAALKQSDVLAALDTPAPSEPEEG